MCRPVSPACSPVPDMHSVYAFEHMKSTHLDCGYKIIHGKDLKYKLQLSKMQI